MRYKRERSFFGMMLAIGYFLFDLAGRSPLVLHTTASAKNPAYPCRNRAPFRGADYLSGLSSVDGVCLDSFGTVFSDQGPCNVALVGRMCGHHFRQAPRIRDFDMGFRDHRDCGCCVGLVEMPEN